MISVEDQRNLFVELGNKLPREITVYAIGGTAMMFSGFKDATLDIDLVFTQKDDRNIFKEVAKSLGYKEMDSVIVYGVKNNHPEMIKVGDSRLDLFLLDVIDYTFSEGMQKRANAVHQFGKNLKIKIADKHDIIVMKSATRRAKDEEDIVGIIKSSEINWGVIIEEAKTQFALGRDHVFLDMGSLVEKLTSNYKLNIPKRIGDTFWKLLRKQTKRNKKEFDKEMVQ